MFGTRVHTTLPVGALLGLAVAIGGWYLYLEPYRMSQVAFSMLGLLIGWEAFYRASVTYSRGFLMFLLAVAALYSQLYGFSVMWLVPTVACTAFVVYFLTEHIESTGLSLRDQMAVAVAYTESLLLLHSFGIGVFLKGTIAMCVAVAVAELLRYSKQERWRAAAPYGILTLLLLGFLIVTTYVAR